MSDAEFTQGIVIFWLIGITLSIICLVIQILLYILVPTSRKLDLKILTQITFAMIVNVTIEYLEVFVGFEEWALNVVIAVYIHVDCASTFWKFVFSKNLYDKVVQVFATEKTSFVVTSLLVWLLTLPVGVICSVLYSVDRDIFLIYVKVYLVSRLVIHFVNLLLFCRIFYVAIRRNISLKARGILRICITLFVLITISSAQVLLTYLAFYIEVWNMMIVCFVINPYQALAVTAIFVILVNGSCKESIHKVVFKRFNSASSQV